MFWLFKDNQQWKNNEKKDDDNGGNPKDKHNFYDNVVSIYKTTSK